MSRKRINPTKKIQSNTPIHPTITADNETIRFSFKHLALNHNKFSFEGKTHEYFGKVFERLKNISSLTASEIFSNRSSSLRTHPINWDDTTEKTGFTHLNQQLRQIPAYQFQISSNEHGRVHGFILDNIFFVIWLDPEHRLYANA
ncbi:MAG: hypothetical protein L3J84_07190 [Gammaproteobacteria bacterium]|nr:hypothetical protein [Gammaproteobacteria bacterium]